MHINITWDDDYISLYFWKVPFKIVSRFRIYLSILNTEDRIPIRIFKQTKESHNALKLIR